MNRKYWIDMLRGAAITLIVIGHFFQGYSLTQYIYIFHVPLFFVISGLCYNNNNYKYKIKDFLFKKLKTLIIPYFSFGVIIVPMAFILENDFSILGFIKVLAWYFIQRRYTTMWFLTTLFGVEITFFLIHKAIVACKLWENGNDRTMIVFVSMVLSVIFIAYESFINISLPWNIDLSMVCLGFYCVGYMLQSSEMYTIEHLNTSRYLFMGIITFVLGMVLGIYSLNITSKRLDLFYGEMGMPVIGILGAVFSCIGLVYVFCCLRRIRFIENIGRHTMIIFALHQMLFKQLFLRVFQFHGGIMLLVASIITITICFYIDVWVSKSPFKWLVGREEKCL